METTTHTPGPWAYRQSSGTLSFTAKISDSDHNIPSIATIHDSAGRGEANTRLIAAAPELLQVCRECAEYWRDTDAPIGARLREAIAKATGGAE